MSKLKTLKDLIVLCDVCKKFPENNCHHPCCRNHKRVKQEAIKHTKSCLKYGYFSDVALFVNFFNITDEELK